MNYCGIFNTAVTYHENVICVRNLASSSEELTKIIKLGTSKRTH